MYIINPECLQTLVFPQYIQATVSYVIDKRTQNLLICMNVIVVFYIFIVVFFKCSVFSICICVRFIQGGLGDTRSQTLPVNSSLSEQNGIGDSSTEIQSQRSPDGSEDGDSSQSKARHINSGYAGRYL